MMSKDALLLWATFVGPVLGASSVGFSASSSRFGSIGSVSVSVLG